MTMPVVKADLIRSLGEQMKDQAYMRTIEEAIWEENKHLAQICNHSMDTLDLVIDNDEHLRIAHMVGRTVYLMMYNAIRQQLICDELE